MRKMTVNCGKMKKNDDVTVKASVIKCSNCRLEIEI